jgi:hypothetical protein
MSCASIAVPLLLHFRVCSIALSSVKDRSLSSLITLSAGTVVVDPHRGPEEKREIGFLGRPVKLRANNHLAGPWARFVKSLALTASTLSNFDQLQCHADWSPSSSPWALGPYLGPDVPPQTQPNHMVPTLADTEGSLLNPLRKGACSPKFDCMACPSAEDRGSKAIALPSGYLMFLFSFLQVLYSRFLGDFASRTFFSGANPPTTLVCSCPGGR